jgi:hypothetical protein
MSRLRTIIDDRELAATLRDELGQRLDVNRDELRDYYRAAPRVAG